MKAVTAPQKSEHINMQRKMCTVLEILPPSWSLPAEFPVAKPQHCLVFSVGRFSQGLQKLKHQRSSEMDMRNAVTAWVLRSTVHNTPSEVSSLAKSGKPKSKKAFISTLQVTWESEEHVKNILGIQSAKSRIWEILLDLCFLYSHSFWLY